jgi:hypothetical protein
MEQKKQGITPPVGSDQPPVPPEQGEEALTQHGTKEEEKLSADAATSKSDTTAVQGEKGEPAAEEPESAVEEEKQVYKVDHVCHGRLLLCVFCLIFRFMYLLCRVPFTPELQERCCCCRRASFGGQRQTSRSNDKLYRVPVKEMRQEVPKSKAPSPEVATAIQAAVKELNIVGNVLPTCKKSCSRLLLLLYCQLAIDLIFLQKFWSKIRIWDESQQPRRSQRRRNNQLLKWWNRKARKMKEMEPNRKVMKKWKKRSMKERSLVAKKTQTDAEKAYRKKAKERAGGRSPRRS